MPWQMTRRSAKERKTMHYKSESELITESRNGNSEAMDELFRRHYPVCLKLARRILPTGDESSDAVQSAYLSAFRSIESFRGDSTFKTWITRIVINQCLMRLRDSVHSRRCVSLDDLPCFAAPIVVDKAPTPEAAAQGAQLRKTLADTCSRLPRPLRDALALCAFSDLSIAEAANRLGLSVPATKTRIFRARSFIRSELAGLRAKKHPPKSSRCAITPPLWREF
jgi:RNA polymerase sigma-70 factor, ECF subfamily